MHANAIYSMRIFYFKKDYLNVLSRVKHAASTYSHKPFVTHSYVFEFTNMRGNSSVRAPAHRWGDPLLSRINVIN
jgi:hypothetical protein